MTRTLSTACKRGTAVLAMLAGIATSAHAECWFDAGQRHNIDPLLLYSIAKVESSLNPSAINRNRNGTYDIGLMQINSTHLPRLSKAGITREKLLNDSCTSVMAWRHPSSPRPPWRRRAARAPTSRPAPRRSSS